MVKMYSRYKLFELSSVGKRLNKNMQQVLALWQNRFFFKYLQLL